MSNFTKILMSDPIVSGPDGSAKWSAIFEATLMMFLVALIPKLIILDPSDIHVIDLWEPILSAAMAAIYTYIRARGIKLEENIKNE